jgi:hypothetical protein
MSEDNNKSSWEDAVREAAESAGFEVINLSELVGMLSMLSGTPKQRATVAVLEGLPVIQQTIQKVCYSMASLMLMLNNETFDLNDQFDREAARSVGRHLFTAYANLVSVPIVPDDDVKGKGMQLEALTEARQDARDAGLPIFDDLPDTPMPPTPSSDAMPSPSGKVRRSEHDVNLTNLELDLVVTALNQWPNESNPYIAALTKRLSDIRDERMAPAQP